MPQHNLQSLTVVLSGFSRERDLFKALTQAIMEIDKSKICRVGCQTGDRGKANAAVQIQRLSAGRIPLAWGKLVFCSIQAIN